MTAVVVANQMIARGTDAERFLDHWSEQRALYRYDQAASGAWGTAQSMGGHWQ